MKHDELVERIRENTLKVFGEEIHWQPNNRLPGPNDKDIYVDLIGTDSENRTVLVEVKTAFSHPESIRRRGASHESVGQVLSYGYAYLKDKKTEGDRELKKLSEQLRFFIVGTSTSPTVECICKFLQAHDINISHRAINSNV